MPEEFGLDRILNLDADMKSREQLIEVRSREHKSRMMIRRTDRFCAQSGYLESIKIQRDKALHVSMMPTLTRAGIA